MNAFYIILAACPVLLLGVVRKGDRRDLASPACSRLDAITRRVTGAAARRTEAGDS